jgi:hypothetical protein
MVFQLIQGSRDLSVSRFGEILALTYSTPFVYISIIPITSTQVGDV